MNQFVGANYRSQCDDILSNVNRKARIVQCIQCYNEIDFIEYTLKSIYNEVDRIVVVEGAVANNIKNNSFRSTDGTIEIIQDFKKNKDKDGKLTFIQFPRAYESLEEMKQIFLNACCDGDWIVITDADEFIHSQDIQRLRVAIDRYPLMKEAIVLFAHFYRDAFHVRRPQYNWQVGHQRIFRYRRGMKYLSHPVVTSPEGICTFFDPRMQIFRINFTPPIIYYHYGYCRPNMKQIMEAKQKYYKDELEKFGATKEFDEKVKEFLNCTEDLSEIGYLSFEDHPEIIRNHPIMQYKEPFYEGKDFVSYKEFQPFKDGFDGKDLPTIYHWMEGLNPRAPMFKNSIKI